MLTGNKGEWSEIYTLFKIISDQALFAGDRELNRIEGFIFPILKILRDELQGTYEYSFDSELVIIEGDEEVFKIAISEFREKGDLLLTKLLKTTKSSFAIPEIERFINSFSCTSLKAKSSVKSDIRIVVHDQRTSTTPELGFSIKSQLGGASTLLNAGKTTNFIYRIENVLLTDDEVELINSVNTRSKIKDRIEKIKGNAGTLAFVETESTTFGNNLTLIDTALPYILSDIVRIFFSTGYSKMIDLVKAVAKANPMNYDLDSGHPFYSYKIKRFLTDIALGMMPSMVWKGQLDATGGYLVVKDDGEVLCYHIYNRNEFEDYLLNNTRLETASSSRHNFGKVYRKDGYTYFNLNLQIRFLK